ncbi:unnamed protein product [Adineta ricciae]|uniref:Uncharacterized protein n=1 Tax=Adineta ricciae TaxID=249248 RepID=A0A815JNM4_ADIRI|nr:unnamed protein product [Adineta ricciae]
MSTDQISKSERFRNAFKKFNIYYANRNLSQSEQLVSTRIFISLLILSILVIILSTSFTIQAQIFTVNYPSEDVFNQLSMKSPLNLTLTCLCQQSSINQGEIVSFNPSYHPICSSQFVNETFLLSLSDIYVSDYYPLDYRLMLSSHIQFLQIFCRTINEKVIDVLRKFSSEYFITTQVLSFENLQTQLAILVKQLQQNTMALYKYVNDFIWYNIFYNVLLTGLRSNVFIVSQDANSGLSYSADQYGTVSNSCNCRKDDTCVHPAYIYNDTGRIGNVGIFGTTDENSHVMLILPNLKVGCFPYKSLLSSTFQCFYNQSCLNSLQEYIQSFSLISPLKPSRFAPETLLNDLLNSLLIESWNEVYNFSRYYEICSPKLCTYSYDRSFNMLYMVVTVISLFGGLKVILFLSTPFLIRFFKRIDRFFFHRNQITNIESNENQNESIAMKSRLTRIYKNTRQQIQTYNMFPLSRDGIYSTRIYILFLFLGLIILLFYSSISTQIRSITIKNPTFDIYKQLFQKYSSTLTCSCSQISIKYSSIINISTILHQVCSSDFIQGDKWLFTGMGIFRVLQKICHLSIETITNELAIFNNLDFFSTEVLTNDTFYTQILSIIEQFKRQTLSSFRNLYQLVQVSIQFNHFIIPSSYDTGFLTYKTNSTEQLFFWSLKKFNNYNCSCTLNDLCTESIGIFCSSSSCSTNDSKVVLEVPDWYLSCSPINSLSLSSLTCFYNSSCVQMLIDSYSLGMPSTKIDPRAANVTPLDPLLKSRFKPSTRLEDIISQLFVEEWINSTSFEQYYHKCSPNQCDYTYEERFSISYIITTIAGIIGGLSVALKILVPICVTSIRRIFHYCCSNKDQTNEEENNQQTHFTSIIQIRNKLQQMNFYRQGQINNDILPIKQQRSATRFYIILFVISFGIILIFLNLDTQITLVTISSPSLSTFEGLNKKYSSTLTCSCSNIAISYSSFITISVSTYHQICSTDFVSLNFITLLWGSDDWLEYGLNYDKKILSSLFRILSMLCTIAKDTIEDNIQTFFSKQIITLKPLTRYSFQNQIDSIIENFIIETLTEFQWGHNYITDMFHANQLQHKFNLNWKLYRTNTQMNYIVRSFPVSFNESGQSCLCTTSPSRCFRSEIISYNKTIKIPGIVFGCLPIDGLRQSTFECFYNSTCINQVANFFNMNNFPNALNQSVSSRFYPISSKRIGQLIDELFIETWQNSSNYTNYYNNCSPLSCEYSYITGNSIIYMITRFLGLYGGLTVALKLFAWHFLNVYWKMRRYINHRHQTNHVVSFNSN